MKKIVLFIILLLTAATLFAQPPQAFKYKAVARDRFGRLIIKKQVDMRISILRGSKTGTVVYRETHTPRTNQFGIINLEIGYGSPDIGLFEQIDWSIDNYYIQIEMDPKCYRLRYGHGDYTVIGTAQLLSVPYALYAGSVKNSNNADPDPANELISDAYLNGTLLSLVEGGITTFVDLSGLQDGTEDADANPSNELNTSLALNGTNLELSDAGGTLIADLSSLASVDGITFIIIYAYQNDGSEVTDFAYHSTHPCNNYGDKFLTTDLDLTKLFLFDVFGPEDTDDDGDGYTENQNNCDDTNDQIYPGAPEICGDGIDQDCDGEDLSCTVTDIDGNVYNVVVIGTQVWMAENLRTTTTNWREQIENVWKTGNRWEGNSSYYKYTWYEGYETNAIPYGALYNLGVVESGDLCPTGWRVPNNNDYSQLRGYIDYNGGKLKESGTEHWASPNTGATNETGFTALSGGVLFSHDENSYS